MANVSAEPGKPKPKRGRRPYASAYRVSSKVASNGHAYTLGERAQVLERIRNGATIRDIESDPNAPNWDTIQNWRYDQSGAPTPFNSDFVKAMRARADLWADDSVKETLDLDRDNCTHEQINAQRLRNGIRMWIASKDHAERLGDKPQTQVQVGIALCLTEDQRLQLLARRERALTQ